jgi:hypothetical protein
MTTIENSYTKPLLFGARAGSRGFCVLRGYFWNSGG